MKFENVWIESYIMGMICTYQYIMTIQYPFYKDGFGPLDACGLNYLMYSIYKKKNMLVSGFWMVIKYTMNSVVIKPNSLQS